MPLKYAKNVLALALVTIFAQLSLAGQGDLGSMASGRIRSAMVSNSAKPIEVKNLPLILDTRNLKIDKLRDVRVENLDLKQTLGPGSSGGGGLCAFNITSATAFIVKHLNEIPFTSKTQRDQFLAKMTSVRFLQGANLEVRGQSVNAINIPSASAIILDEKSCDAIEAGGSTGYSVLLHEYLGVANIDDTTYQVSNAFAAATQKQMNDGTCETAQCMKKKAELKLYRVSLEKVENDLAFDYRTKQVVGPSADLKKEFSKVKNVKNVSAAIAELKRQIKDHEIYARDECEGGCNSEEDSLDQIVELKIELASVYRDEITRLLAELADETGGY